VVLSKWSLDQSEQAVSEAQKQTGIAQTAFEEGTRAVIATKGLNWDNALKTNEDSVVNVVVLNVGKSPTAFFGTRQEIVPIVTDKKFGVEPIDVGNNSSCDPNNYSDGVIPSFPTIDSFNSLPVLVDKLTVNSVISGNVTIAIRGCIFYKAFDMVHYTGYCYIAAQGGQIATLTKSPLCAHGNFAR
jgi:hypothetical protein